jgi:hypothetical protein
MSASRRRRRRLKLDETDADHVSSTPLAFRASFGQLQRRKSLPGTAEGVSASWRRGSRPCSAVPPGWQHTSKDGRWYPSLCMPLTGRQRRYAVTRVLAAQSPVEDCGRRLRGRWDIGSPGRRGLTSALTPRNARSIIGEGGDRSRITRTRRSHFLRGAALAARPHPVQVAVFTVGRCRPMRDSSKITNRQDLLEAGEASSYANHRR